MTIDGTDVGCMKNGGFLRVDTSPGAHMIKMPKVTESDWANETSIEERFEPGKIYYYEWTHELENFYVIPAGAMIVTGGKTKASIIQHTKETALPVLSKLRNSVQ